MDGWMDNIVTSSSRFTTLPEIPARILAYLVEQFPS